jgi:hypothetical protein
LELQDVFSAAENVFALSQAMRSEEASQLGLFISILDNMEAAKKESGR